MQAACIKFPYKVYWWVINMNEITLVISILALGVAAAAALCPAWAEKALVSSPGGRADAVGPCKAPRRGNAGGAPQRPRDGRADAGERQNAGRCVCRRRQNVRSSAQDKRLCELTEQFSRQSEQLRRSLSEASRNSTNASPPFPAKCAGAGRHPRGRGAQHQGFSGG